MSTYYAGLHHLNHNPQSSPALPPPITLVPVLLHTHMHTCAHTRWIAIYNVCTWQYKKCTRSAVVLFLLQQHTIDFSPQFSQAVHSFTTLGVYMQHPYTTHDKPSVPILIFSLLVINGCTFKHAVYKYLQFFCLNSGLNYGGKSLSDRTSKQHISCQLEF